MNLVGHVAVGLRRFPAAEPEFLLGCMLPDLAAMARVRLAPASGAVGDGVALHHASDAVFHSSDWFREHNLLVRDDLLAAGVDRGPARASAHAGLEMLLDGGLAADPAIVDATEAAFAAARDDRSTSDAVAALVDDDERDLWRARVAMIGRAVHPGVYTSTDEIAWRLHRMTRGRTRIELPRDQVDAVAVALEKRQGAVVGQAGRVVSDVVVALP
ncbi:MAG TPA: hypothetical protein VFZ17_00040 [Acidimicrobiia bacterium]|nr:hypothetical protein [Acidimicrobiia bacterium]